MTKNKESVADVPKGDKAEKVLTLVDVQNLLKRDLHACLLMLSAVHDDQDVVNVLAGVLHGKYLNSRHKAELEKQTEIKP